MGNYTQHSVMVYMREKSKKKRMDMYVCVYIHPVYIQCVCVYMRVCVCVCVKVKVAQYCPTLCDPMDSTVHEILQARILDG